MKKYRKNDQKGDFIGNTDGEKQNKSRNEREIRQTDRDKGSTIRELKTFIILWSTQSLSQLGSAMTNFALTLWLYEKTGSALQTALLSICSYAPYVMMSIFAGALSDRWDKKKVMLVCDTLAAGCTVIVFLLLKAGTLAPVHMYLLNAVNGLMNTVQQPAGDVAMTLLTPRRHYQKTSGMRSFSNSLVTILHPVLATSLFAFAGMEAVIYTDLFTFGVAFLTLLFFVKIPAVSEKSEEKEPLSAAVKAGIRYLTDNRLILFLILFLASVNLVASAFDAVLPALVLPRENGGEAVLGIVTSCSGVAMLIGSIFAAALPAPKNRVRVIYGTMLISLSIENFLLAFGRTPLIWCAGQVIGWILVPVMNANLDVILRSTIPAEMQGRVYSCRNTFQFFTIPIGFLLGGFAVDEICEPIMASASPDGLLRVWFGGGKGSGAGMMMGILGVMGTFVCLCFGGILQKYQYVEDAGKP